MKKNLFAIAMFILVAATLQAQAPEQINYQAVVRGSTGTPVANNTPVKLKFTIHDGSASGSSVFTEIQNTTTNQFGLVNVQIGSVSSLSTVNWGSATKFLQVELDINNSGTYTDMGTSQLLSVPYALSAKTSDDNSWLKNGDNIYNANSGNVGIGTVASFYKLHVVDSVGGHIAGVKIENKGDGGLATLVWANKAGSTALVAKWSADSATAYNVQAANMLSLENYNGNLMFNAANNNIYLSTNNGQPNLTLTSTGNLGVGTITPAPSAALDITSTTGGLLLPRMTTAQRDALVNPAEGLVVYNTNLRKVQAYTFVGEQPVATNNQGGEYVYVDSTTGPMGSTYAAQTFQTTANGTCDSVSFWVLGYSNSGTQFTVQMVIYQGTPGTTLTPLATTADINLSATGKYTVAIPGNPAMVTGTDYTFALYPRAIYNYGVQIERTGSGSGNYSLGNLWRTMMGMGWAESGGDDLKFEVISNTGLGWVSLH